MADIYVNLGISTSGAPGTTGDPLGYDEFQTHFGTVANTSYFVKGYHDYQYPDPESASQAFLLDIAGVTTITSWGTDIAKIRASWVSGGNYIRGLSIGTTSGITLNIRRILFESHNSCLIGSLPMQTTNNLIINLENNGLFKTGTHSSSMVNVSNDNNNSSMNIKGCLLINRGSIIDAFINGPLTEIDSCYIEGLVDQWGYFSGTLGSIYKYCGFYNIPGEYPIAGYGFTDGGNNVGNGSGVTQFASLGPINTMTLPDDVTPLSGSPLIDSGNPALGLSTDMFNNLRGITPDIGAAEFPLPLSYFSDSSSIDGTTVTSYIDRATLVTSIQSDSTDTYFDSTNEINRVMVFYRDSGHRQNIRIVHEGPGMSGDARWSPGARDGTWEKYRVIAFDSNGARHDLNRASIGSSEDITHSDGTMTLNT